MTAPAPLAELSIVPPTTIAPVPPTELTIAPPTTTAPVPPAELTIVPPTTETPLQQATKPPSKSSSHHDQTSSQQFPSPVSPTPNWSDPAADLKLRNNNTGDGSDEQ